MEFEKANHAVLLGLAFLSGHFAMAGHFPITFDESDKSVSPQARNAIRSVISQEDARVLPLETAAEPLRVRFLKTANNADFAPGTNVLETAMYFSNYDSVTGKMTSKTLNESLPVVAHEYGHYIFDMYMRRNNPRWDQLVKQFSNLAAKKAEIDQAIANGRIESKKILDLDAKAKTAAERKVLMAKDKAIMDHASALLDEQFKIVSQLSELAIFNISTSYNELFADTMAVLVFRNGKVITQLLSFPTRPYAMRDFTRNTPVKGWSSDDDHMLLDPVRSFLWKRYLSAHVRDRNFSEFTRVLLESIQAEVNARDADPSLKLTSEQINQRLIDRLDSKLPR